MLLTIENLVKTYQSQAEELTVFDHFSLNLGQGEILGITGESGSGKSTLLNLIAGLDNFQAGTILCNNLNIGSMKEKELARYRNSNIGFIFQFHFLLSDFTALENVCMPALIAGLSKAEAEQKAKILLDKVGLRSKAHNFPDQLSGGERQRVAIARALINNAPLILADEPTGSLDEKNSQIVEDLLFSLLKEEGKSMILVSHDLSLAEKCGKRLHLEK